jgi:hypothetical protein
MLSLMSRILVAWGVVGFSGGGNPARSDYSRLNTEVFPEHVWGLVYREIMLCSRSTIKSGLLELSLSYVKEVLSGDISTQAIR